MDTAPIRPEGRQVRRGGRHAAGRHHRAPRLLHDLVQLRKCSSSLCTSSEASKGCAQAFGRDPTLWEDPLRFDPERWLQPTEESEEAEGKKKAAAGLWRPTTFSDFVYPVFNAGPRLCLGRPLAYLEIQLMLAVVFGRYELAEARQHTEAYLNTLVAPMKEGLLVTLRRKGA